MSLPSDPHDPRFELDRQDLLVLAALGEPIDAEFDDHRRGCAECQAEFERYARTIRLGRDSAEHRAVLDAVPAPSVWSAIAAELSVADPDGGESEQPAPPADPGARSASAATSRPAAADIARTPWRRRTGLVAAAVVVVAAIAGGGGFLAGRHTTNSAAVTSAQAALATMPGGPSGAAGRAVVRSSSQGSELSVRTQGLPLREGYYEVWLFDPDLNQMVAVGTLAADGGGSFPVPPGLDPHRYHVVDVSAQNYDGNPAHQQSVLRGALTQ